MDRRLLVPVLVVFSVALAATACGGQREMSAGSTPTPIAQPDPSESDLPSYTPSRGKNPPGMPLPFYVVAEQGLIGPTLLGEGTGMFTVTNNGTKKHHVVLVRLPEAEMDPMEQTIRDIARSPDGIPPGATVLEDPGVLQLTETATVKVDPLTPGWYALIEVTPDPKTGSVRGADAAYTRTVHVVAAEA